MLKKRWRSFTTGGEKNSFEPASETGGEIEEGESIREEEKVWRQKALQRKGRRSIDSSEYVKHIVTGRDRPVQVNREFVQELLKDDDLDHKRKEKGAIDFKPPLSRKEIEEEKMRFLESLHEMNRVRKKLEEEGEAKKLQDLFLCSHGPGDITSQSYNENETCSLIKKRYKLKSFSNCPYCVPKTDIWCPFHRGKQFKVTSKLKAWSEDSKLFGKMRAEATQKRFYPVNDELREKDEENITCTSNNDEEEPEFFMSLSEFRQTLLDYPIVSKKPEKQAPR